MQLALGESIGFLRAQFENITIMNLSNILKGIAIVYFIQIQSLEADSKVLLGQLKGDYAWGVINRRQQYTEGPDAKKKANKRHKGGGGQQRERGSDIMDPKKILEFTKKHLLFLSGHNTEKLQLRDQVNDAGYQMEEDPDANMLRNSAQPEEQNFNDLLNGHVSELMVADHADGGFKTESKHQDDIMNLMQSFPDGNGDPA